MPTIKNKRKKNNLKNMLWGNRNLGWVDLRAYPL